MSRSLAGICAVVVLVVLSLARGPEVRADGQDAAIAGRVLIDVAGDRTPARRAAVTLTPENGGKPSTVATGRDGEFSFAEVAAGRYVVEAEKPGFVPTAPRKLVEAKAGATSSFDLIMRRGGALEGRFLNYLGLPIRQLTVVAEPVADSSGARPASSGHSAITDDLGRFRIHTLPPGRYRLGAPGTGWYYPGTANADDAGVLSVGEGETLGPFDLAVPGSAPDSSASTAASEATERPAPVGTSITGRVALATTGEGVDQLTVSLSGATSRSVTTDRNGRFAFGNLPSGEYLVTVRAVGYFTTDGALASPAGAGLRITLRDGERKTADIPLTPGTAMEGRLVDEFGDPAPGVVVRIAQRLFVAGKPFLMGAQNVITSGPTNDLGRFRFTGLPAGDFYLIALPAPFDESKGGGFAPTLFPGTASPDAAAPVRVVGGAPTSDLTVGLVGTGTRAIAGVVLDPAGRPVPRAIVRLLPTDGGEARLMVTATVTADSGGEFAYRDVPDGAYVLQAVGQGGLFGVTQITVAGIAAGEPLAATVSLRSVTTARGRVVIEGDGPPPVDSWQVGFEPTNFVTGPAGSAGALQVRADPRGNFELRGLAWHGLIRASAGRAWVTTRVRLNGRDITDTPYDFQTADVSGIEIVLTNRLGVVSGTVQRNGQPAADARVLAFGGDDVSWAYLSRTLRAGVTDASGAFTLPGLVAGNYLVVVRPPNVDIGDPDALARLRAVATPIVVTPGRAATVTLMVR